MTLTQRAFRILMERMRVTSAQFDAGTNVRYGVLWTEDECRAADEARYEALQPLYVTYERLRRRAALDDGG